MQVNLLRQANAAPTISAWAYLHGQHDFNRHPLAPLGIECHVYIPPGNRKTWAVKSNKGYYIGTTLEHYRYYKAYCNDTRAVQGSETMFFKHKYITAPTVTPEDAVIQIAQQLTDALQGKVPPPLSESGLDKLKTMATIFSGKLFGQQAEKEKDSPGAAPTKSAGRPRVEEEGPPPLQPMDDDDDSSDEEEEEREEAADPECVVTLKPNAPTTATKLPEWMDRYQEQVKEARSGPTFISQEEGEEPPAHNT